MASVDQSNSSRRRITFYLGAQLFAKLDRARVNLDPKMDMSAFLRLVIIEWCDDHADQPARLDPGLPPNSYEIAR